MRALLLKGADREATDNDGRTAAQVIGTTVPENTRLDLEQMLVSFYNSITIKARPSYWECLMIKTPLVPLKPNHKTQLILGSILTLVVFILWTIIFPRIFPLSLNICRQLSSLLRYSIRILGLVCGYILHLCLCSRSWKTETS